MAHNDPSNDDYSSSQASAQQNAPQTSAIVVKEPVFQTNGPYKVQEMMNRRLPGIPCTGPSI